MSVAAPLCSNGLYLVWARFLVGFDCNVLPFMVYLNGMALPAMLVKEIAALPSYGFTECHLDGLS